MSSCRHLPPPPVRSSISPAARTGGPASRRLTSPPSDRGRRRGCPAHGSYPCARRRNPLLLVVPSASPRLPHDPTLADEHGQLQHTCVPRIPLGEFVNDNMPELYLLWAAPKRQEFLDRLVEMFQNILKSGSPAAVDGPIGRVAFGDVAGPGMVDQPFGQRQRQNQVALGDGDEAVAQTVEPELTDHRLIPSLRCGVFRRRVSTQQFIDPSAQLLGDLLRERPCGDAGAARQEPLQDFRFDPRLRHKRLHRRGRGREADHAQTFIHGRGPRSVWSTRRRECYDVSVAGACSFNINASIRSAILCAGSRSWPMVQSAA